MKMSGVRLMFNPGKSDLVRIMTDSVKSTSIGLLTKAGFYVGKDGNVYVGKSGLRVDENGDVYCRGKKESPVACIKADNSGSYGLFLNNAGNLSA